MAIASREVIQRKNRGMIRGATPHEMFDDPQGEAAVELRVLFYESIVVETKKHLKGMHTIRLGGLLNEQIDLTMGQYQFDVLDFIFTGIISILERTKSITIKIIKLKREKRS
jgi:hypothetical protein